MHTEGTPLPGIARVTETIRNRPGLLVGAGTVLALAGAGSASAATVAASAPSTLATPPTITDIVGRTTPAVQYAAASHGSHLPAAGQTAVHSLPGARQGRTLRARYSRAHQANTWSAVSSELNRQTNPVAAAQGIRPAADRLQPVPISGPQSWMPLTGAQYSNATTIVRQVLAKRMGVRSAVVALATAMQESRLLNIGYGTGDSLGLFQQQWDMGWGSPQQIMNPVHASDEFLSALHRYEAGDPSWAVQPLYQAAQGVQGSAFPFAYAQWEAQAAHLTHEILMHLL